MANRLLFALVRMGGQRFIFALGWLQLFELLLDFVVVFVDLFLEVVVELQRALEIEQVLVTPVAFEMCSDFSLGFFAATVPVVGKSAWVAFTLNDCTYVWSYRSGR